MSGQDYFQIYIDTIADALKRVRKIGFKKFNLVKDLVDTV
jgi:threonine dehydratase